MMENDKKDTVEYVRLINLILRAKTNAANWKTWEQAPNNQEKDFALTMMTTKIGDLVSAIVFNRRVNKKSKNNLDFIDKYELLSLNTIEDNLSDICIRLFEYMGRFNLKLFATNEYMNSELENINHIQITPLTFCLYISKAIIDIKFNSWPAQNIGEALGKIFAMAHHYDFDLWQTIELRLKYLEQKHNHIKPRNEKAI